MSANNFLLITEEKNKWVVEQRDADTGSGYEMKSFKTLEEAIKFAQEYMEEEIVEYGIHFNFKNKK